MTRTLADLPGPRRVPALGNALAVRPTNLHAVAERWSETYGPLFRFDLGRKPVIAIADATLINRILRERPQGYRRWSEIGQVLTEVGADGVFAAEGDGWKRQRRLAVTALNAAHIARYFSVIAAAAERLQRRLGALAAKENPSDPAPAFSAYTVDVTSALAFGQQIEELDARDDLDRHLKRVFDALARRVTAPVAYWRVLRLPADRAVDGAVAALRDAVAEFVARAKTRIEERPELREHPENFLEGMLAAQEIEGRRDERELFGNVLTMLLAGEDTTSHTLAWASWFMAVEPRAQARLAAEADEVLGHRYMADDAAHVEALPYAEAFLRETLRLRPAAPVIFVQALDDTRVADVEIPAGTRLLLLGRAAALHEENFSNPTSFEPERWLEPHEAAHNPRALLTFGAGPRFCPGRNLAFAEGKAALALVARNYEISLPPAAPAVRERFGFTMAPEGLSLRLRSR